MNFIFLIVLILLHALSVMYFEIAISATPPSTGWGVAREGEGLDPVKRV